MALGHRVVIPDLQSKRTLRDIGMSIRPLFPEDHAPRSREFWLSVYKELYRKGQTQVRFLPRKIILLELESWIVDRQVSWARSPKSAKTLLDVLDAFIDLVVDEHRFFALIEWLKENSKSLKKSWAQWVFLARQAFLHLQELGFWSESWIKEYLSINHEQELKNLKFDYSLYFDLGDIIDDSEQELILALGTSNEVFKFEQQSSIDKASTENLRLYRFEHELLEKKELLNWLKQEQANRPLQQIAIITGNPKRDRLLVHSLMVQAGLAPQEDKGTLFSIPRIREWGYALLSAFSVEDYDHLEFKNFVAAAGPREAFGQFFAQNWTRLKDHNSRVNIQGDSDKISFEEFVFGYIKDSGRDLPAEIGNLVHRLLMVIPLEFKFKKVRWARFLVAEIGDMLVSTNNKLTLLDFDSLLYLPEQPVFMSQLSESVFQPSQFFRLVQDERFNLKKDLGWMIKGNNFLNRKKQLDWVTQQNQTTGTFFEADVEGKKHAPSLFFLEAVKAQGELNKSSVDKENLQDAVAKGIGNHSFPWIEEYCADLNAKQPVAEGSVGVSASSLEKYLKCPFVFKAEKLFKLQDFEQLSVELGARTKGKFLHKLAQEFSDPARATASEHEIEEKVRALIDSHQNFVYDDWFKERLVGSSVRWVLRFISSEAELRSEVSDYKIVGHEVDFAGVIDANLKQILPLVENQQLKENQWKISGRIDRLEATSDSKYKVIDYKTKRSNHTHSGSWLDKDQLQLLLYSMAIENGLTQFAKGTVEGALFYFLESLERSRGMVLKDVNEPDISDRSKIDLVTKDKLFAGSIDKIAFVLEQLKDGNFAPIPKDTKDCKSCSWRDLCRASHLS